MEKSNIRLLFLAPFCDANDVGEAYNSFVWVKSLAEHVKVTLLSLNREGQENIAKSLKNVEVITWPEPKCFRKFERFNAMVKPGYLIYYLKVRRWIRKALEEKRIFDVIHQMTPAAMRYPSPGIGFGIPLVHGPLQGSLDTPKSLARECHANSPWYMSLRNFDIMRFRYDPLLRHSLKNTDLVLTGAEYAKEIISNAPVKSVKNLVHLNCHCYEDVFNKKKSPFEKKHFVFLYVGRLVRTKGVREAIQALKFVAIEFNYTFEVVGDGPEYEICKELVKKLNVESKVVFHGHLPKSSVEAAYRRADLMIFPSFREPAGGVVLEALSNGIPVVTINRGGPGYYVTRDCGYLVKAETSQQMAKDIADFLNCVCSDRVLFEKLQKGAVDRAKQLGNLSSKTSWLLEQYRGLIQDNP